MTTMTQPTPAGASTAEMAAEPVEVTGGVDTHKDTHTAAVLDPLGRMLGHRQFPATAAGYAGLLAWLREHGDVVRVGVRKAAGVEGSGVYGAGLAEFLQQAGIELVEVDRPDRKTRRRHGKSDPIDAETAARAAQSAPPSPGARAGSRKPAADRSMRCARCGSPVVPRSRPALMPNARSKRWS